MRQAELRRFDQALTLRWGRQLDVRPVYLSGAGSADALEDARVAGYIAKYATKGAEATGTPDRSIQSPGIVAALAIPDHPRRMISACWDLAARPEYTDLNLRQWSHMLGYRGHFLTKSRRYSATLATLRQALSAHQATEYRQRHGQSEPATTVITESHWHFIGSGYRDGEVIWAEDARRRARAAPAIEAEREAD